MKVAVVDDSMEDRELLAGTAEETLCALGQGQTFLQLFPSGEMLLKDFQPGKYELVFLDIFLEGRSTASARRSGCARWTAG